MKNKITTSLFIVFPFCCLFSQKYTVKEIDSLLIAENHKLNTDAKYKEAILFNEEIIKESEEIDYTKGVAKGNYYLGSLFSTIGSYKESFKYLDKAKKMSENLNDNYLNASILLEYAKNYQELGLHKEAVKTCKKTVSMASSIKEKYDKESILLYSYSALMSNYYALNVPDSAYHYLIKSYKTEMSAYNLSGLAYHHLNYTKRSDSTEFYLNTTQKVLNHQSNLIFEKAILENLWGDFYASKKQYNLALNHYLKSIPFGLKSQATTEISNSYKGVSDSYEKLGEIAKSKEYFVKYSNYKDSLSVSQKKLIDVSIQTILEEKQKEVNSSRRQLIIGLSFILLIAFGFTFIFLKKNLRERKKFREALLSEHNRLKQTEDETNKLKQMVNPAFKEVVELAKANSSEFPVRFKQVYPEFCKRLLAINSDLQASDLKFCAYISLNFSTKDIAEYTFTSPRSVQSKKYRMRKKLNINKDEDIYLFMTKLMEGIMS